MDERTCERCATPIGGPGQNGLKRFCSERCRVAAQNRRYRMRKRREFMGWPNALVTQALCAECGTVFDMQNRRAKYCSKACGERSKSRARYALTRGALDRSHARRAGDTRARVRPMVIFERDAWVCGICGRPVDKALTYPDPMSASVDHITPISLGGAHTPENVRCTHLRCNVRRGNRLGAPAADCAFSLLGG